MKEKGETLGEEPDWMSWFSTIFPCHPLSEAATIDWLFEAAVPTVSYKTYKQYGLLLTA